MEVVASMNGNDVVVSIKGQRMTFSVFLFFFLFCLVRSLTEKTVKRILTIYSPNDVVSCKEVTFGGVNMSIVPNCRAISPDNSIFGVGDNT